MGGSARVRWSFPARPSCQRRWARPQRPRGAFATLLVLLPLLAFLGVSRAAQPPPKLSMAEPAAGSEKLSFSGSSTVLLNSRTDECINQVYAGRLGDYLRLSSNQTYSFSATYFDLVIEKVPVPDVPDVPDVPVVPDMPVDPAEPGGSGEPGEPGETVDLAGSDAPETPAETGPYEVHFTYTLSFTIPDYLAVEEGAFFRLAAEVFNRDIPACDLSLSTFTLDLASLRAEFGCDYTEIPPWPPVCFPDINPSGVNTTVKYYYASAASPADESFLCSRAAPYEIIPDLESPSTITLACTSFNGQTNRTTHSRLLASAVPDKNAPPVIVACPTCSTSVAFDVQNVKLNKVLTTSFTLRVEGRSEVKTRNYTISKEESRVVVSFPIGDLVEANGAKVRYVLSGRFYDSCYSSSSILSNTTFTLYPYRFVQAEVFTNATCNDEGNTLYGSSLQTYYCADIAFTLPDITLPSPDPTGGCDGLRPVFSAGGYGFGDSTCRYVSSESEGSFNISVVFHGAYFIATNNTLAATTPATPVQILPLIGYELPASWFTLKSNASLNPSLNFVFLDTTGIRVTANPTACSAGGIPGYTVVPSGGCDIDLRCVEDSPGASSTFVRQICTWTSCFGGTGTFTVSQEPPQIYPDNVTSGGSSSVDGSSTAPDLSYYCYGADCSLSRSRALVGYYRNIQSVSLQLYESVAGRNVSVSARWTPDQSATIDGELLTELGRVDATLSYNDLSPGVYDVQLVYKDACGAEQLTTFPGWTFTVGRGIDFRVLGMDSDSVYRLGEDYSIYIEPWYVGTTASLDCGSGSAVYDVSLLESAMKILAPPGDSPPASTVPQQCTLTILSPNASQFNRSLIFLAETPSAPFDAGACAPLLLSEGGSSVFSGGTLTNGARYRLSCEGRNGTFVYVETCYTTVGADGTHTTEVSSPQKLYPADGLMVAIPISSEGVGGGGAGTGADKDEETTVTLRFTLYRADESAPQTIPGGEGSGCDSTLKFSVRRVLMARPSELFYFDHSDLYAVLNLLNGSNLAASELGKYVICPANICDNYASQLSSALFSQYQTCVLRGAAAPADGSVPETVSCYDPGKYYYGSAALKLFHRILRPTIPSGGRAAFAAVLRQYVLDYLQNFQKFVGAMSIAPGDTLASSDVPLKSTDFEDILLFSKVLIEGDASDGLPQYLDADLDVVYSAIYDAVQLYIGQACAGNVPPLGDHRLTLVGAGERPPVLLDLRATGYQPGQPVEQAFPLSPIPFPPASASGGSVYALAMGYTYRGGKYIASSGLPGGFAVVQLDPSGVSGALAPLIYLPLSGYAAVAFDFQGVNLTEHFGPGYANVECWARPAESFVALRRGAQMGARSDLCTKTVVEKESRVVCDCSGGVYVTLGMPTPYTLALPLWAILVIALGLLIFLGLVLAIIFVCLGGSAGCSGSCCGGGRGLGGRAGGRRRVSASVRRTRRTMM